MNRFTMGGSLISMNTLTGLYEVSRTLTLIDVKEDDYGNFSCFATADIPGTGVRNISVHFQLMVLGKSLFSILLKH